MKNLYEEFHEETKIQRKNIDNRNFTYKPILGFIEKYVDSQMSILDIGCGSGTMSLYLAGKGNSILGIDISKKAIKVASSSSKYLNLEKTAKFSVLDYPRDIPKKKFDVVLMLEVLEHLREEKKAIYKARQALNNKGLIIVSVPSSRAPLYRLGLAKKFDKKVGHLRRYSVEGLIYRFEHAGFHILEVKKTEGIVRNFLFLDSRAGKIIKFIKGKFVDLVTFLDDITLVVGESDIIIVAQKI